MLSVLILVRKLIVLSLVWLVSGCASIVRIETYEPVIDSQLSSWVANPPLEPDRGTGANFWCASLHVFVPAVDLEFDPIMFGPILPIFPTFLLPRDSRDTLMVEAQVISKGGAGSQASSPILRLLDGNQKDQRLGDPMIVRNSYRIQNGDDVINTRYVYSVPRSQLQQANSQDHESLILEFVQLEQDCTPEPLHFKKRKFTSFLFGGM